MHRHPPRVAMVQNSARKGNAVDVLKVLRSSPGLEDIWQLHWERGRRRVNSAGVSHCQRRRSNGGRHGLDAAPRGGAPAGPARAPAPAAIGVAGAPDAAAAAGAPAPAIPPTAAPAGQAATPEAGRGQPVAQGATGAGRESGCAAALAGAS